MDGYQEKVSSVSVPKNTGIEGFLKTLRSILTLPRVQSIHVDSKGKVNYTRYVREGESEIQVAVDYTELEPWNIIRNGQLEELHSMEHHPAASVIATMFNQVAREGLVPVAFATGTNSHIWEWHQESSGVGLLRTSSIYGLPLYPDAQIPDHSLILCAAFVKGSLINCHRFISTSMVNDVRPPDTSVSVL